ncbi:hypothetical protein PHET_09945 [Paragonimus heterotremus]|uniref:Uncharacterized protein n=1 Tax=Paragonimus heterotremus TaxID=100268 RepID=A0A8J4SSU3_9TREM|nr:hypothetical protein PHET_09945 [Paragonimus heterotremus]
MFLALILCAVPLIKSELTQNEKEKTLCFHNTLLQIMSNCISPVRRKVNTLTWNKTLEYFAHVYSMRTYFEDVTIPDRDEFERKADIIATAYEVDHYEGLYEILPKVTEHYSDNIESDLPKQFYRLIEHGYSTFTILLHRISPKSSTNKATQMGCDYAYTNRTVVPAIHILCFINCPYHVIFGRPARGKVSCLYRDHSVSFSKCKLDTPCNNSPGLTRMSLNTFRLFCLILVIIEI